jgi:hypothetical protein
MHNFPSVITVTSVFKMPAFLDCLIPGWWLRQNSAKKSRKTNAHHIKTDEKT